MSLQSYGSENLAEIAALGLHDQGWNYVLRAEKLLMRYRPFIDPRRNLFEICVVIEGRQQQSLRGVEHRFQMRPRLAASRQRMAWAGEAHCF